MQDDTKLNNGHPFATYADNHNVIHPVDLEANLGWIAFKRLDKTKPVLVHVKWFCENMMPRTATFELPPES